MKVYVLIMKGTPNVYPVEVHTDKEEAKRREAEVNATLDEPQHCEVISCPLYVSLEQAMKWNMRGRAS